MPSTSRRRARLLDGWGDHGALKLEDQFQERSVSFLQYPTAAMVWIGEVEDVKSFKKWKRHLSLQATSKLEFENLDLDFKIASGPRKVLTRIFKKQVTTSEGKAQLEKRSLTGRQIAWMIHDVL